MLLQKVLALSFSFLFLVQPAISRHAWADPAGGTVVTANASISQSPGNTTVTSSSTAVQVNWQSFNLGANDRFTGNLSNGGVLANFVTGGTASSIAGTVNCVGCTFALVNPSGITLQNGVTFNTGATFLSALPIDPTSGALANGTALTLYNLAGTNGITNNSSIQFQDVVNISGASSNLVASQTLYTGTLPAGVVVVPSTETTQSTLEPLNNNTPAAATSPAPPIDTPAITIPVSAAITILNPTSDGPVFGAPSPQVSAPTAIPEINAPEPAPLAPASQTQSAAPKTETVQAKPAAKSTNAKSSKHQEKTKNNKPGQNSKDDQDKSDSGAPTEDNP